MSTQALASPAAHGTRTALRLPVWAPALAMAIPLASVYLLVAPPAGDLAAATYRSALFARAGFALRDSGWYAAHGHWLPGYSLLSPELGAWLGVRVTLALSALAAAVLFALIAARAFGPAAARLASAWFALGFGVGLLSGRVPYDLGLAIGLGAVLALMQGCTTTALALAVLTSAASPVAGAFLALAGMAFALAHAVGVKGERAAGRVPGLAGPQSFRPDAAASWRQGLAVALAALAPIVVLALAFPEGGYEPFAPSAFWPALAGVVAIAALLPQGPLSPQGRRTLRVGAGLYALALIGAFVLQTPVGGNAARLGALLAGPLLAGVGFSRQRLILCLLAPALLYWQLETPINDELTIAGDPSTSAAYYAPLRAELARLNGAHPPNGTHPPRRAIVEVPLTAAHWEASYLAGHDGIALARGWERQLDTRYAALFYRPSLSAAAYRGWLAENEVAYVALPDARLDYAGQAEGALIARGVPYLREVWRGAHWRVYAVASPSR